MSRQVRRFSIPHYFNWAYNTPISQIERDIRELKELGATEICISPIQQYGVLSLDFNAATERIESEEEYRQRLEEEKVEEEGIREGALAVLRKLDTKSKT